MLFDPVVRQRDSFKAAVEAVGVSARSLREWHEQLAPEPQPCDEETSVELLREENRQLKKRLQRVEMERDMMAASSGDAGWESTGNIAARDVLDSREKSVRQLTCRIGISDQIARCPVTQSGQPVRSDLQPARDSPTS